MNRRNIYRALPISTFRKPERVQLQEVNDGEWGALYLGTKPEVAQQMEWNERGRQNEIKIGEGSTVPKELAREWIYIR